jgi:dolichyl-phosphate-mannose-protein mannosyltransferase
MFRTALARFSRSSVAPLAVIAIATIAVRLPFLVLGDRFFDSDEAIEGLMAQHVWRGEFPVFLWGQSYKGVPEVYLNAIVTRLAGPGVVPLKATTLALFAVYACLQFVLLRRLFGARTAALAAALLLLGPPVLVLWSLSANPEIVWTLIAGAVLLLAVERWSSNHSTSALAVAGLAAGFGLWVHQYIVYYLVALAAIALAGIGPQETLRALVKASDRSTWNDWIVRTVLALAVLYAVLGTVAFLTTGFDLELFGRPIGVHHPQKLWRFAAGFLLVAGVARWLQRQRAADGRGIGWRTAGVAASGFVLGASLVLFGSLGKGGGGPVGRMDASRLASALPTIATDIVPMLIGFKSPTTETLPIPGLLGLAFVVPLVVSYAAAARSRHTRFFHVFVISTFVIFLLSGAYIDAQSYRYLMPLYCALPVVYAIGIDRVWQTSRNGGLLLAVLLAGTLGAMQIAWYQRLAPDVRSQTILRCLADRHARFAWADYWTSYKLTFLSGETIVVAPAAGPDRYPPYSAMAREDPSAVVIPADLAAGDGCERIVPK